eukprot:GDKJ01019402.1.p2 GENE.GDKJ01019402.1~~GDKJ01019402.1.p2  ORF type:complete len:367 (-),score=30.88 GDKJ01019402.1:50-1150(-)
MDCGATYDLKASFFQVELPDHTLFTFVDEAGHKYGLTRMPMGICTAPEIMQIITSVLAGDRTMVQPQYASKALVDVWIDNVLFSGSEKKVKLSVADFTKAVSNAKATINWKDSSGPSSQLQFIGMSLNFANKTIALAPKNHSKLEKLSFASRMIVSDIESATSRLMYASSVLGVPLTRYYFAIKFLRRKLSEINRETITRSDTVSVPPSSLKQYQEWQAALLRATPRKISPSDKRMDFSLWTDASTIGWGAVLVNDFSQQVKVVAGKWTAEEQLIHINVLEAKALHNALRLFDDITAATLACLIDNTSVVSVVSKGFSHSADLNEQVLNIQNTCALRRIRLLRPKYVNTKENIADVWSRVFPSTSA